MFNRVMIIVAIKITFHDHVCVLQEGVTLLESFYVSVKYRACIYQSRMKGLCMIALLLFAAVLDVEGNLVPTHFRFINYSYN